MATENLVIKIDEKGALVVQRNIEGVGKSAKATTGALKLLKRALFALAGAVIIKQLVGMADAFTVMQNKLKIVTTGTENLVAVTEELFEISKRTRSSFEATSDSFSKFALSAKELGRSQQEILQFTELVNKAVIIGGSAASEAKGGLRQLAQGIASGALRGDELISVLENLPFVADTIAKGLSVTRGELRDMGKEGKITAQVVLDAFKDQAGFLNTEYEKTVITVGQAFGQVQNAVLKLVGDFDRGKGASTVLAQGILAIANGLLAMQKPLEFIGDAGVIIFRELAAALGPLLPAWEDVRSVALDVLRAIGLGTLAMMRTMLQSIDLGARIWGKLFKFIDDNFGDVIAGIVQLVLEMVNLASGLIQGLINGFITGLNVLRRALGQDDLANFELFSFDPTDFVVKGRQMGQSITAGLQTSDLTSTFDEIVDKVQNAFVASQFDTKKAGEGVGTEGGAAAPLKAEKESLTVLEKTVRALEQEAIQLGLTADEAERAAGVFDLKNAAQKAGQVLLPGDIALVDALIRENQELAVQAELLATIRGPQLEYERSMAALIALQPQLTAKEYATALKEIEDSIKVVTAGQQALFDSISAVFDTGLRALQDFGRGGKLVFREFATAALDAIADVIAGLLRLQFQKAVGTALGIPGFKDGGSLFVQGTGGTDSQLVAFRATPGERVDVSTRAQQRVSAVPQAPAQAAPSNYKIVNVLDPSLIREAMASEEGTRTIMNTLSSNKTTVRQVTA